jgi:hypothetical protein
MKRMGFALIALMGLGGVALAQPGEGGMAGRLAQADANKDGKISKDEVRSQRGAAFDRLDANKDGFISAADRAQAAEGPPKAGEGTRGEGRGRRGGGEGMMRFDADGDQKVSRAEFVDRGFEGFDRLDANKDGALDQSELQAARGRRGAAGAGL